MVAKIALKLFKVLSGRFLEGFGKRVFFKSCPEAPEVDFGASGGGFGVDLEPPGVDLEWIWSLREC